MIMRLAGLCALLCACLLFTTTAHANHDSGGISPAPDPVPPIGLPGQSDHPATGSCDPVTKPDRVQDCFVMMFYEQGTGDGYPIPTGETRITREDSRGARRFRATIVLEKLGPDGWFPVQQKSRQSRRVSHTSQRLRLKMPFEYYSPNEKYRLRVKRNGAVIGTLNLDH